MSTINWAALQWSAPIDDSAYPPLPPMQVAGVEPPPGGVEAPAGSGLAINAGGVLTLSIASLPTSPGAPGTFWNNHGLLAFVPGD